MVIFHSYVSLPVYLFKPVGRCSIFPTFPVDYMGSSLPVVISKESQQLAFRVFQQKSNVAMESSPLTDDFPITLW